MLQKLPQGNEQIEVAHQPKFQILDRPYQPRLISRSWRAVIGLGALCIIVVEFLVHAKPDLSPWSADATAIDRIRFYVEFATLIFLGIYVRDTAKIADATALSTLEAQEARAEALAPRIMVYFEPSPSQIMEIVIANFGRGTARDVTFAFEPALQGSRAGMTSKAVEYFRPKPMLPPTYRSSTVLGTWPEYFENQSLPQTYAVTVEYAGVENGKRYSVTHVLDTRINTDRLFVATKGTAELITELSDLGSDITRQLQQIVNVLRERKEKDLPREQDDSADTEANGTPS